MTTPKRDARGVEINIGDTCIYPASAGDINGIVEGTVAGFTQTGRVQISIIRRTVGGYGKMSSTTVDAHKVVIVSVLPETDQFTLGEESALDNWRREFRAATGRRATVQEQRDKFGVANERYYY